MFVTAWNNSAHHASGAGYGIRISLEDLNLFNNRWNNVRIRILGQPEFLSRITNSFWTGKCHEIRNQRIGIWIISLGHRYWDNGHPPIFEFNQIEDNLFELNELG